MKRYFMEIDTRPREQRRWIGRHWIAQASDRVPKPVALVVCDDDAGLGAKAGEVPVPAHIFSGHGEHSPAHRQKSRDSRQLPQPSQAARFRSGTSQQAGP